MPLDQGRERRLGGLAALPHKSGQQLSVRERTDGPLVEQGSQMLQRGFRSLARHPVRFPVVWLKPDVRLRVSFRPNMLTARSRARSVRLFRNNLTGTVKTSLRRSGFSLIFCVTDTNARGRSVANDAEMGDVDLRSLNRRPPGDRGQVGHCVERLVDGLDRAVVVHQNALVADQKALTVHDLEVEDR